MYTWSEQLFIKAKKLYAVLLFCSVALALRSFALAWWLQPFHLMRAQNLPRRISVESVPRGAFTDSRGKVLSGYGAVGGVYLSFAPMRSACNHPITSSENRFRSLSIYIRELSDYLGNTLGLLPKDIEDIIYSRLAIDPSRRYLIQDNVDEKAYSRLKGSQHLWPGLICQFRGVRYHYTAGNPTPLAAHTLGYVGRVWSEGLSQGEQSLHALAAQLAVEEDYSVRSFLMKQLSMTQLHRLRHGDWVGREGLERSFDSLLRGRTYHRDYYVNSVGRALDGVQRGAKDQLNYRSPSSALGASDHREGETVVLTLDSELQSYCERLLMKSQPLQDHWLRNIPSAPWIKPGAIVVMQPTTGKILALASYPTFDSRDFEVGYSGRAQSEKTVVNLLKSSRVFNSIEKKPGAIKENLLELLPVTSPLNQQDQKVFMKEISALTEGKSRSSPDSLTASVHTGADIDSKERWLETFGFARSIWFGFSALGRSVAIEVESRRESDRLGYQEKWLCLDEALINSCGYGSDLLPWIRQRMFSAKGYRALVNALGATERLHRWTGLSPQVLIDTIFSGDRGGHHIVGAPSQALLRRRIDEVSSAFDLDGYIKVLREEFGDLAHNGDKLLALDITRLLIRESEASGSVSLGSMSDHSCHVIPSGVDGERFLSHCRVHTWIHLFGKQLAYEIFRRGRFETWRKLYQRSFLKEMRFYERREKRITQPYMDYISKECDRQFALFWQKHEGELIDAALFQRALSKDLLDESVQLRKAFKVLLKSYPLIGEYFDDFVSMLSGMNFREAENYLRLMRSHYKGRYSTKLWGNYGKSMPETLEDLLYRAALGSGSRYMRHRAVSGQYAPGSIFKLVVAYEMLRQRYLKGFNRWDELNPFTLDDRSYPREGGGWFVARESDGKPIFQIYRGGRLPRSLTRQIGSIGLLGALHHSSNPYFALGSLRHLQSPEIDLLRAARDLGYGSVTGLGLSCEGGGNLPEDLMLNTTGLYTTSIGQHKLLATPLQTAVMLSTIANGGYLLQPRLVEDALFLEKSCENSSYTSTCKEAQSIKELSKARSKGSETVLLQPNESGQSGDRCRGSGAEEQEKPYLLSSCISSSLLGGGLHMRKSLFMPEVLRSYLLEGMRRVVSGEHGDPRLTSTSATPGEREASKNIREMTPYVVGKTSTAQYTVREGLSPTSKVQPRDHVWFGAISFKEPLYHGRDDLVQPSTLFDGAEAEIVVVVMLENGTYGRQAASLAMQVIKRYKELEQGRRDLGAFQ